jgi:hypothetical protein
MAILQYCGITTTALEAVKKVLPPTNSAYPTTIAVVLLLGNIIIK